jgi:hypothetical protein
MKPTNSPGFNYSKHQDSPVELRLVRADSSHERHYVLQFRILGRSPFRLWHPVRKYYPTNSPYYRPGSRASSVYGRWNEVCFYASSMAEGEAHLDALREKFHTVNDIFESFVKEGLALRDRDLELYLEYRKKTKMPRVFR